jgi:hypothetical protein
VSVPAVSWGRGRILVLMMPRSAASRRHLSASPFNVEPIAPPVETFALADRVSHDTYGLGRIASVENETAVVVDFATEQIRFTAPYNKLFKL